MKALRMHLFTNGPRHQVFDRVKNLSVLWSPGLGQILEADVRQAVRTTAKPVFDTVWEAVRITEDHENLRT